MEVLAGVYRTWCYYEGVVNELFSGYCGAIDG